jgi:hypothetical protein
LSSLDFIELTFFVLGNVNRKEMIEKLATLDQLKDSLQMDVPFEVLRYVNAFRYLAPLAERAMSDSTIDEKENPHKSVSHRRIEQAAVENQFASGKIEAIKVCYLNSLLKESWPPETVTVVQSC